MRAHLSSLETFKCAPVVPCASIDDRKSYALQSSKQLGPDPGEAVAPMITKQLAAGVAGVAILFGCAAPNPDLGSLGAEKIDYNWHVRPILSENCFRCHGPD